MQVTKEWFAPMMGDRVLTKDVFIAFTVDQGANVVNAIEALGVIVVLCCAHRLNTVVVWMLGIGGTVNTCRNKPMEVLMRKLAACVGKFSHSAVNIVSNVSRFVSVVSCLLILLNVVLADVGFSTAIFFHNMKTGPAQPRTSMRAI